ncbi:MAG: hypothetical protein CM15mP102_14800 [Flavobacteriales bacterium]|nr:MAG: hypothetical protein CM15mP102_14800 [Flavobacteriales bacterium]
MSVQEKLIEQTGVIGEKLEIGSFEKLIQTLLDLTFMLEIKLLQLLVYLTI